MRPKQLKNFCRAKETINRVKRQSVEWEKIVVNYETDESLISKIYEKFLQLINKQTNKKIQLDRKTGIRTKQTFLQRRRTDGQQPHEKMLNIIND